MNLFEKIDLFEKMAGVVSDDDVVNNPETIDNIEESGADYQAKASVQTRLSLLKLAHKL